MIASVSSIQYALNFLMNGILICQGFSQIFELFLPFCCDFVLHSVHET